MGHNNISAGSASAASILALYAAREYIGEDNNPRSNRVLQKIKAALDAIASCGAESNRHSGAVGAEKRAEQSNPGGGHEVISGDLKHGKVSDKPLPDEPTPAGGRQEVEWRDEDYERARDCMMGILSNSGWITSDIERKNFDNAFQHAVGILSLTVRITTPAQTEKVRATTIREKASLLLDQPQTARTGWSKDTLEMDLWLRQNYGEHLAGSFSGIALAQAFQRWSALSRPVSKWSGKWITGQVPSDHRGDEQ